MIKRYMPTKFPHRDEPVMHPERDGWWVRYEDHAAEVERLRAENERLSTELHHAKGEAERLRRYVEQFIEPVDRAMEAAIYGAAFANAYPHVSARVAMGHADDAVEAWREARKGGGGE